MRIIRSLQAIFAVLLACITAASASLGTVVGFTDGEPITTERQEYCFDNDRLLIGGYGCIDTPDYKRQVEYMQAAEFDFIVTGRKMSEAFLTECDEKGLGVIPTNQFANASYAYWEMSDETVAHWKNITQDNYSYAHPCIWGDNLIDEPTSAAYGNVEAAVSHYYANTTGKLPLVNLFPMYANSQQLGTTSTVKLAVPGVDWLNSSVNEYKQHVSQYINTITTDYICVDIYPLNQKVNRAGDITKTTYGGWLRNLDILAEGCRATNRDLWVITQCTGISLTEDGPRFCDSENDIRWQAYVTLAFGARAIIHACYYGGWWNRDAHMINEAGERTDTYYAVKAVDSELAAFADVYGGYTSRGAYLVNGRLAAGNQTHYLTPVEDKFKPAVVSASPLLVGCFEADSGDGSAYVFANMNEPQNGNSANATVYFEGANKITLYRKGETQEISGDTVSLNLDSCEGVFVTVE